METRLKGIEKAVLKLTNQLLKLKRGQRLLLYLDQGSDIALARAIQKGTQENGVFTEPFELDSTEELSEISIKLAHKIETGDFDIICELSEQYFYQTIAWKRAIQLGSKLYSLCGLNVDSFTRCVGEVDHDLMDSFGMALKAILTKAKTLHVVTDNGTDVRLQMKTNNPILRVIEKEKRKAGSYIGNPSSILTETNRATFMGGQLAFQGIAETISGTAVIDGYLWPPSKIGLLSDPIVLNVKRGRVIGITGGSLESQILNTWLEGKNKEIQHFCIGFNPGARLDGKILEAERVFGCLSVGIGRSPFHTDGIIKKPSIIVNHITIEHNGSFIDKDLSAFEERLLYGTRKEETVL